MAQQTAVFFEDQDLMATPNATVVQLAQEGIVGVEDLADFNEESLKQVAENLRRPAGRIRPDPGTMNAAAHATIPTPLLFWSEISTTALGTDRLDEVLRPNRP